MSAGSRASFTQHSPAGPRSFDALCTLPRALQRLGAVPCTHVASWAGRATALGRLEQWRFSTGESLSAPGSLMWQLETRTNHCKLDGSFSREQVAPPPPPAAAVFIPPLDPTLSLQAASALASLAASHQLPSSPQQVEQLLDAAQPGSASALALPALALLARWARQAALQPAAARDVALLQRVAEAARSLLASAAGQPRLASACLLLLASTAIAAPDQAAAAVDAAEAVSAALAGPQLQAALVEPGVAAEVASAVGALLPCLMVSLPRRRLCCSSVWPSLLADASCCRLSPPTTNRASPPRPAGSCKLSCGGWAARQTTARCPAAWRSTAWRLRTQ